MKTVAHIPGSILNGKAVADKRLGKQPTIRLLQEDISKLEWLCGKLRVNKREFISLAATWLVRETYNLAMFEKFTTADIRRWREDYPLITAHYNCGLSPQLLNTLGKKYSSDPSLYLDVQRELGELFGMNPDRIPHWVVREVIWGVKGAPRGWRKQER